MFNIPISLHNSKLEWYSDKPEFIISSKNLVNFQSCMQRDGGHLKNKFINYKENYEKRKYFLGLIV